MKALHLLPLCILFIVSAYGKESTHKNVIVIMVDDLGCRDLGYTGSEYYESPNVDKLAEEGVVFTDGYAACMVCSPSRVSIMTGQTTARHGVTDWIGSKVGTDWRSNNRYNQLLPADYVRSLPSSAATLPEAMQSLGYKTFFTGKWHMGTATGPSEHGFEFEACRGGGTPKAYYAPFKNSNIKDEYPGESLTMRLAEETVSFMKNNKEDKFFIYLSFHAVHGPVQTTKDKWAKYRDKAEQMGIADHGFEMSKYLPTRVVQDNPIYGGLIETMDDAVGVVLEALEELDLDENTAVIFTSDNGGVSAGDNYSTSNLPLRMGKGNPYEGGFRVPFVIKVPWLSYNSKAFGIPVCGTDIYPTVLDIVDADLRPNDHKDGVSLLPLIKGDTIAERGIYWHYPHYANQGGEPASIIRKGEWKLIHLYEDDVDLLYDMSTDSAEMIDLSLVETTIANELRVELDAYLLEVNAILPVRDELYDASKEQERLNTIENNWLPDLETQRMAMLSMYYNPGNDWWGSDVTILPLKEKLLHNFEDAFEPDVTSIKGMLMSTSFQSSGVLHSQGFIANPLQDEVNSTSSCFAVDIEDFKWDDNFIWLPVDTNSNLDWVTDRGIKINQLNRVNPDNGIEITDDNRYLHVMHYRSRANDGGASVAINSKHLWNNGQGVARFDFKDISAGEWVDLVCDLSYFKDNNLKVGHISVVNSTQWGNVAATHPDYTSANGGRFRRTIFAWDELVLSSQPIKRTAKGTPDKLKLEELTSSVFYPLPFDGQQLFVSEIEPDMELWVYNLSGVLVEHQMIEGRNITFKTHMSESLYIFQLKSSEGMKSYLVPVNI